MHRSKPTSRANGLHSHGPVTPAGRDRSRLNSLKHGLAAKTVTVLETESQEDFDSLLQSCSDHFQPMDQVEADLVKDIADARWGLLRLSLIETTKMNELIRQNSSGNPEHDMTEAFCNLSQGPMLPLLLRYQSSLQMKMKRAAGILIQLRNKIPVPAKDLCLDETFLAESVAEAEPPVEAQASPAPQPRAPVPNPTAPAETHIFPQEVPTAPLRSTIAA